MIDNEKQTIIYPEHRLFFPEQITTHLEHRLFFPEQITTHLEHGLSDQEKKIIFNLTKYRFYFFFSLHFVS